MMSQIRVVAPLGMLGYGFPESSFAAAMETGPHVIACDAGSTDAGPHKLGKGVGIVSRAATRRDLTLMIEAARKHGIPVIVGSSGGSGAAPHLAWTRDIVTGILRDIGWSARVALIHSDVSADTVLAAHASGDLTALRSVPEIDADTIGRCGSIVAQMGPEPIMRALEQGADIVLCGRAYDPTMFAALPIVKGFDPGLALHMGKIMECGAQCAIPGAASDCMVGTLNASDFVLAPSNPARACTPLSVAAHTLYEKADPALLPGPGGSLDLSNCNFEPVDDRSVRVSGSRFVAETPYRVKLEGAELVGFRSIAIAGIRDPIMINVLDECLDHVRDTVAELSDDDARIDFIVYGRDGVLGASETDKGVPKEVGVIIEGVADTQEKAASACSLARSSLLHYHYSGRKSTSGNLAFPFAPSDFDGGPVYRFALYHTISLADPCEVFPIEWVG